jgi:hypothetical protein
LQEAAARFVRVLPHRLATGPRHVAPEPTPRCRGSRFPPRTKRRCPLLGCEFGWTPERHGVPRVMRRTARTKRHTACPRLTAWIKHHRHLPGRACCPRLHARVRGHDTDDGVRGNARALNRCLHWARACTFTGLTRRGGPQSRCTWEPFPRVLDRVKRARPRLTEVPRRSVVACRLGFAPRTRVPPKNRRREHGTSGTARAATRSRTSSCYAFSRKDIT